MIQFLKLYIGIVFIIFLYSCGNKHLSKKEYNHIFDSLSQIEVPLVFDSIRFFQQRGIDVEIDSISPEGVNIWERRETSLRFYKEVKHKDSLFWDVYEYNSNGQIERYYRRYMDSCGDIPTGYVVYYNEQGRNRSF